MRYDLHMLHAQMHRPNRQMRIPNGGSDARLCHQHADAAKCHQDGLTIDLVLRSRQDVPSQTAETVPHARTAVIHRYMLVAPEAWSRGRASVF